MYPTLSYDVVCMSSSERCGIGSQWNDHTGKLPVLDSGRPIGTCRSIATTVTLADHHPDARAYIQRYISS
jgi:hypothetical protein